jgi:hypothetical protein
MLSSDAASGGPASADATPMLPPPPIPSSDVRRVANDIIAEMTRHPSWSVAQRMRYALREHETFVKSYPKLTEMCIGVHSFTDAQEVRRMLSTMLTEMDKIESLDDTFDGASTTIGKALGDRYLPAKDTVVYN